MKGVVAEHVTLLIGLLGMEQRERGAETDLGCWLGVRGRSYRNKRKGRHDDEAALRWGEYR